MFADFLASAPPSFEKSTEDGIRFRIYKCGSLEVRTCQEPNGKEVIGAVFSVRPVVAHPCLEQEQARTVGEGEKVVRVTQYVERSTRGISKSTVALNGRPYHQF